jgi:site-specific DNA recombinase
VFGVTMNDHKKPGQRAIIIGRVSSDAQRDNYSIGTQVRAALAYVKAHGYGLTGDKWVDPDSGRDTEAGIGLQAYVDDYTSLELSRPGLDAAIAFLETSGYDVAVIHALDRLARDPYIRRTLELEFERRGARVEYVLGNYENSPEGEVRKDMDATFAKWENAKRVERCLRGKRGKAESGLFVAGKAPYGYTVDQDAAGGLAIFQAQADVVVRIFEMYVNEGQSIRSLAADLQRRQVFNHSGSTEWGKTSIARILANETYAGLNYYNKWRRSGRKLKPRPRSEWIAIPVSPIIDRDTFEAAQSRLAGNRQALRRQPKRFYLLGGMIRCTACERQYVSGAQAAGKQRRAVDALYYRHRKSQGDCLCRQFSARVLEPEVWQTLVTALNDPDKLRRGYVASVARQQDAQVKTRAHLEQLERGRAKQEQKLENLAAMYVDPDMKMSKTEYLRQKALIDLELAEVNVKAERASTELAKVPTAQSVEAFDRFTAAIRRRLKANRAPTNDQKRQLMELLHVTVWIAPDGGRRVDGWFAVENEQPGVGLLAQPLGCCGCRPRPPPARA